MCGLWHKDLHSSLTSVNGSYLDLIFNTSGGSIKDDRSRFDKL